MNFTNLATGAALGLAIAVLSTPAAKANVILTYTGNDFTFFTGNYTGTDKVTATITLANPLGDNLNLSVTPLAFSLNDGVQTITNASSNLHPTLFQFSTDSSGAITGWNVSVAQDVFLDINSLEKTNRITTTDDPTQNIAGDDAFFSHPIEIPSLGENNNIPGAWTAAVQPAPAPPLSSLAAFGVLGLAFLCRHGRRIFGLGRVQ